MLRRRVCRCLKSRALKVRHTTVRETAQARIGELKANQVSAIQIHCPSREVSYRRQADYVGKITNVSGSSTVGGAGPTFTFMRCLALVRLSKTSGRLKGLLMAMSAFPLESITSPFRCSSTVHKMTGMS